MVPELVAVLAYTAMGLLLVWRLGFFRRFGLPVRLILVAFLARVFAGVLSHVIHLMWYGGDAFDYWHASLYVYNLLHEGQAGMYLRMVFEPNVVPPPADIKIHAYNVDYWSDNGAYLLVRFHSLIRLIGWKTMAAHIVIYNFLCLIGLLYLFRSLSQLLPHAKMFLVLVLFFYPTQLFWTSLMLKEGAALAAMGLLLDQVLRPWNRISLRQLPPVMLGTALLLLLRNFWLAALLPVWTAWQWVEKKPGRALTKYLMVMVGFLLLFAGASQWFTGQSLPQILSSKQAEFLALKAESRLAVVPHLEGRWLDLLTQMPLALWNSVLQPIPHAEVKPFYLLAFADHVLVLGCFLFMLYYGIRSGGGQFNLFWFSFFFSFILLLLIGYTVPIAGAIVRYKVVTSVFLLVAAASFIPADQQAKGAQPDA
ncbi:MAG: hypothetical protein NZM08_06660 [Chitinophagales bacterium]|nr:hypothetical protein [Chitinophagales bacterium]